ncbi:cytochrome c551 [Thalassobacillus cyri]|uniref:Cytochrome c551 n=1 Tax=Thalassobacillus cyri TaxID=571932 RepID=A0A1H4AWA0_9BACI|nr:cytochrome c [Thalassobacillus cyri]SEA40173.1 cytochrome c551 [Thalassobacillus cyri]
MKKALMAVLFGSALVLGACGGGGDEGAEENGGGDAGTEENGGGGEVDTAAAEQAYQESCASCHGGDLSGGAGPSLKDVGSKYSKDEILNIIKNGKGSMPAGQATGEDADMIAGWLATQK